MSMCEFHTLTIFGREYKVKWLYYKENSVSYKEKSVDYSSVIFLTIYLYIYNRV